MLAPFFFRLFNCLLSRGRRIVLFLLLLIVLLLAVLPTWPYSQSWGY